MSICIDYPLILCSYRENTIYSKVVAVTMAIALLTAVAYGEGLPVKDGKIVLEHTIIDLSESQAEEIEVLGTLTLTSRQWSQLKEIGPTCPKRFETLLPIDLRDCTCSYGDYVILVSPQKAAIIHSFISEDQAEGLKYVFTKEKPDVYGSRWDNHHTRALNVNVDRQGQYYLAGTLISYEQLQHLLSLPQSPPLGQNPPSVVSARQITFHLAAGSKANAALRGQGSVLRRIGKSSGWTVNFDPWPEWGIQNEH